MSDLTERLRALAEEWWECCGDIHVPITEAADALETAEAKLAAIDGLHHHCTDGFTNNWCAADAEVWPCRTHHILHSKEEL